MNVSSGIIIQTAYNEDVNKFISSNFFREMEQHKIKQLIDSNKISNFLDTHFLGIKKTEPNKHFPKTDKNKIKLFNIV